MLSGTGPARRSLDLSGAAEAHAARDAEMQRVARMAAREVRGVLDRVIVRVAHEIQRGGRTRSQAAQPWRCPAGCKRGSHCARETFREQCLPTSAAIQAQQRKQWDDESLTKVFCVGLFGLRIQHEGAAAAAGRAGPNGAGLAVAVASKRVIHFSDLLSYLSIIAGVAALLCDQRL